MSRPATAVRADRAADPTAETSVGRAVGPAPVRVALIGTHGFGGSHLRNLERLRTSGAAELIGVADPQEPPAEVAHLWHRDLGALLAAHADAPPEVVIIATPIDTHLPLARQALAAGVHVYLEKPPVPSLADHAELEAAAAEAGRAVQIGFQARGGAGVDALRDLVTSGELGEVSAVHAYGAWSRDRAYYRRSRWAGRRRLDGHRVADGVATNPLAHSVHAALVIAGIARLDDIDSVTTELRRAHDIEADDTTFLRIDPVAEPGRPRPKVVCALTTTAPDQSAPWVEISGEKGTVRLLYTEDVSRRTAPDGTVTETRHPRTDLVENLLAHVRDPAEELLCPLAATAPFSAVLEAIQSAPDPAPIAPEHVAWHGEGEAARPVVDGIERTLLAALETGEPFSRSGAAWAREDAITTWHPPTDPAPRATGAPTPTGSRAAARDAHDEENRS